MAHRYAGYVVGAGYGAVAQSVALSAEHDGEAGLCAHPRVVDGDAVVGKGHGGNLEAMRAQGGIAVGRKPAPRHHKYRAHRHADGAAVERVATCGCEHDSVDSKCGCGAEYSSDVGSVAHAVDHGEPAGT